MRAITKSIEPASLTQHRAEYYCSYDNYSEKDELRNTLVSEQRSLCSYCMGRIRATAGSMKIEHWKCVAEYPGDQLNYRNLLGACLGGEGLPRHLQYCDTRKRDLALQWNPADPLHQIESRVRYDPDGTIRGSDVAFDAQLNDVLNLNLSFLKTNRRSVLSGMLDWWKKRKPVSQDQVRREIQRLAGGGGDLQPYGQVAVSFLRKKLAP